VLLLSAVGFSLFPMLCLRWVLGSLRLLSPLRLPLRWLSMCLLLALRLLRVLLWPGLLVLGLLSTLLLWLGLLVLLLLRFGLLMLLLAMALLFAFFLMLRISGRSSYEQRKYYGTCNSKGFHTH
jgi:hypothetical protein